MTGMNLHVDTSDKDLDDTKQLKAKLPIRQHLQLHQIKILEGQNLSETVRQALDDYFDRLDEDQAGDQADDPAAER